MKKFLSILTAVILVAALAACGGGAQDPGPATSGGGETAGGQEPAGGGNDDFRVALLLSGPITDLGWNNSGFDGLMAVEREFGLDVTFKEQIQASDMESDFRFFASTGYNVLIGMGSQFTDAIVTVAEEFPDHYFFLINGSVGDVPNLRSVQLSDEHSGYLAGAVAVMMTETGHVGMVAGQDVPPIIRGMNGFEQGVRDTKERIGRPDIRVTTTMTGSMDDVAMAKEFALSLIDQDVDIIYELANQAGLGVIEAVVERDILMIGSSRDQNPAAPDHILQSMVRDTPAAFTTFIGQLLDGYFEPGIDMFGIGERVIHLAPWHGFEDRVPQEVKDELDAIILDITEGRIVITGA